MSPGDQVEVVVNSLEAWHPSENRRLVIGDIIEIVKISGKSIVIAIDPKAFRSCTLGGPHTQVLLLTDVRVVKELDSLFTIDEIKIMLKDSK